MLTHKIRDMFGNSNSGDESRLSGSGVGGHASDSQSNVNSNQQINFAIKLEKSRSPHFNGDDDDKNGGADDEEEMMNNPKENGGDEFKNWCSKLNEMPENIAAS